MAKRKRLTPANPAYLEPAAPETRGMFSRAAPIADVAREAASEAAMGEMAETLSQARAQGRMVLALPLSEIETGYLVRDRLAVDAGEMEVLKQSLRSRGQQTPVEVVDLGTPGGVARYGLISGWRRCRALAELRDETGEESFGTVLALLRRPAEASDAYLAMVEENEIRVGLSYYERAHVVARAVEQGVFATSQDGLRGLFGAASRAKRSKIGSFLALVKALDGALAFPEAIGERQGLRLAKALAEDAGFGAALRERLAAEAPGTAEAEQAVIENALASGGAGGSAAKPDPASAKAPASAERVELRAGLWCRTSASGAITLSGPALTPDLREKLEAWLQTAE